MFEFGILGSTVVHPHGNPLVHLHVPRRLRQTLAALLVRPNRRLSFTQLVSWTWTEDEAPPVHPDSTLHTYGKRIRGLIETIESSARLHTENGGLRLEIDPGLVDYHVFGDLFSQAQHHRAAGDHERAADLAADGLGLWRDPPLLDLDSALARNWRRAAIADEWLPANVFLLDEQIALGRFDAALGKLGELSRRHGADVRLVKRRLRILHALSRHQEAADSYLTAYQALRRNGQHAEADDVRRLHEELAPRSETTRPRVRDGAGPRLLPPDVVDFAGRSDLLRRLDEHTGVAAGRLRASVVTLAGVGGIGKTTLALRWARRASERLSVGVLYADLRGFSPARPMEPEDVVDDFLARLGFPVEHIVGPVGRAEKLRALLEEQPRLVVLDNVRSSAHVRSLLPLFGACAVVVTGRHRLAELAVQHGIPSWPVEPLDARQGIELLAGRIGERADEAPEALRALVVRCDGLPLALTLVADRIASRPGVPVSALLAQLRDTELLLSLDGDGADLSLKAVFSFSYQALSVDAGRLFRLVGLHPGTEFGIEVAAALSGDAPSRAQRCLDELVRAHLLEQAGDGNRYRMHDLVLAYAAGLADADPEAAPARNRMLSFYVGSALNAHRTAFGHIELPPVPLTLDGVEPVTFAGDAEANAWYLLERANLGSVIHSPHTLRADYGWVLPNAVVPFMERCGSYLDIVAAFTRTAEALTAQQNPQAASSRNDLGHFQLKLGDTAAAAENFERALEILAGVDAPTGVLAVRINLATAQWRRGDPAGAARGYQACVTMAREQGDAFREAKAEHYLGEIFAEERGYDRAQERFERALALREGISDAAGQVTTLAELCRIAGARGRYVLADQLAARASALLSSVRDVSAGIRLHTVLAEVDLDRRRYADAVAAAGRAVELAKPTGALEAEASALDLLGQGYAKCGEPERARDAWLLAAEIFRGRGQAWRADALARRVASLPLAAEVPAQLPRSVTRQGVSFDETPGTL